MTQSILKSALSLSKAERILLAERLWDSIAEDDGEVTLSKTQRNELDKRLRKLKKNGSQGSDWATVRTRILRRRRSS